MVVPSMLGYGFSDRPTQRGMNLIMIPDLWAKLMTEGLGYSRFGAHGGDWGAGVTARLGFAYPDQVVGIHVTTVLAAQPYLGPGAPELSERERAFIGEFERWDQAEGGYGHIQGTKPQTLSYGLGRVHSK